MHEFKKRLGFLAFLAFSLRQAMIIKKIKLFGGKTKVTVKGKHELKKKREKNAKLPMILLYEAHVVTYIGTRHGTLRCVAPVPTLAKFTLPSYSTN